MNDNQIELLAKHIADSIHGKCEHCKAKGICDKYTPLEGPYCCTDAWEILIKRYILNTTK